MREYVKGISGIRAIVLIMLTALLGSSADARPPFSPATIESPAKLMTRDLTTFLDANNLLVFIANNGTIGMDQEQLFGRSEGFYYPFSGDTSEIRTGQTDKTVVYAVGLFLIGKVNGEIRTAVAAYDRPEYVPGTMLGGISQPDNPGFRVYKIDISSGPGQPDYDNWPIGDGAPVDLYGRPQLLGMQTLWTVFNDADSSAHHNYFGGGTASLGIEVRQTVWGSSDPEEANVLYLKYLLYNKGSNSIDSLYISFWADPDIGGPNDDLVGCDSAHNIFFCYNGSDSDSYYGAIPPAWGGKVISGPVVYSPESTATFDNVPMADYRNIGISSFTKYTNGDEPNDSAELFLYAKGLDGKTGLPMIDPITGQSSRYFAGGDAVRLKGWFDDSPSDKRIMVSFGPLSFYPGDSQQVVLKLGAYAEGSRLFSLSVLRHLLDPLIPVDSIMDTTTYVEVDSVKVIVNDYGLSRVDFLPMKERWLSGYSWGGDFFYGGADYAFNFLGSSLDPAYLPGSFHSVEVRFSNILKQRAYRYVKQETPEYPYGGYYEVPFTVWDVDNERQLNAAFVEYTMSNVFDSTWGPDTKGNAGGWELLFVFNSDYSGNLPDGTAFKPYAECDLLDDAQSMDLMYVLWPVLMDEGSPSRLAEGQKILFTGQYLNTNGAVDVLQFRKVNVGTRSSQAFLVHSYADGASLLKLETSDPAFQVATPILKFKEYNDIRILMDFVPYREGEYGAALYVIDSTSGQVTRMIQLVASTFETNDVNDSPVMTPSGYDLAQNYPNPFNPATAVDYSLPVRSNVNITVFNLLGQKVKTLIDENKPAGRYTVNWNGRNSGGQPVASGIYFYKIKAGEFALTRKMVLIK